MRRCLFRVAVGNDNGLSHFMRCLCLAKQMSRQDIEPIFLVTKTTHWMEDRAEEHGVTLLSLGKNLEPGGEEDLRRMLMEIGNEAPRWVLIDGDCFDAHYIQLIRDSIKRVTVIEDYPAGYHGQSLTLNCNKGYAEADYESYKGDVLLGLKYTLLEPRVGENRQFPKTGKAKVFLYISGATEAEQLTDAIKAISQLPIELTVLVSRYMELPQEEENLQGVTIFKDCTPEMVDKLIAEADIGISTVGHTIWSMAREGLPFIVISLDHTDDATIAWLTANELALPVNGKQGIINSAITDAIKKLLADEQKYMQMAHGLMRLMDGKGAERVLSAMLSQ